MKLFCCCQTFFFPFFFLVQSALLIKFSCLEVPKARLPLFVDEEWGWVGIGCLCTELKHGWLFVFAVGSLQIFLATGGWNFQCGS